MTEVPLAIVSLSPVAFNAFPYLGAVPAAPDPANSTENVHSTLVFANNCCDAPRYGLTTSLLTTSLDCGVIL